MYELHILPNVSVKKKCVHLKNKINLKIRYTRNIYIKKKKKDVRNTTQFFSLMYIKTQKHS
jgi:hypothetical protein